MKILRHSLLVACAFALAACGAGGNGGATAPTAFPPEVAARIAQEEAYCADGLGALEPVSLEALQTGEFNADGATDYVLSHGSFRCTEGGFPYCGSAGCSFTVFMSSAGGALTPVEMGNAQNTRLSGTATVTSSISPRTAKSWVRTPNICACAGMAKASSGNRA